MGLMFPTLKLDSNGFSYNSTLPNPIENLFSNLSGDPSNCYVSVRVRVKIREVRVKVRVRVRVRLKLGLGLGFGTIPFTALCQNSSSRLIYYCSFRCPISLDAVHRCNPVTQSYIHGPDQSQQFSLKYESDVEIHRPRSIRWPYLLQACFLEDER